jgi:thiol-disulfide isomerase/thioredoxin
MSKWLRTLLTVLGGLILAGMLVMGLTQAGGVEQRSARDFDLEAAREELSGAPPPVAALYARGNELLGGGRRAFEDTLRSLRGHPVVINKWASWCGPCRAEFPMFQDIATERGKEIAFVGVNSRDATPAARRFLDEHPLPFPSFEDPGEKIAGALDSPSNFPVTLFVDEKGETVFVHQGSYRSSDELAADIDEHLGA